MIEILKYSENNTYRGEHNDQNYYPTSIEAGDIWKCTVDFYGSSHIKAQADGDDSQDIGGTEGFVPCLSNGSICDLHTKGGRWRGSGGTGYAGYTGTNDSPYDGVFFSPTGGTWHTDIDFYALYTLNWFTITLSGTNGESFSFLYDRQMWYDAFQGTSSDIHIDKEGWVWKGDPESGGTLVCGDGSIYSDHYTSSGTDANMNRPTAHAARMFVPITANNYCMFVMFGGLYWECNGGLGTYDQQWNAGASGGYGKVWFYHEWADWDGFADASNNGIISMPLPRGADYNDLGGHVNYYYHRDAWFTAFNGNKNRPLITQDGSVYKVWSPDEELTVHKLVVDSHGVVGPAGGNAAYVPSPIIRTNQYFQRT